MPRPRARRRGSSRRPRWPRARRGRPRITAPTRPATIAMFQPEIATTWLAPAVAKSAASERSTRSRSPIEDPGGEAGLRLRQREAEGVTGRVAHRLERETGRRRQDGHGPRVQAPGRPGPPEVLAVAVVIRRRPEAAADLDGVAGADRRERGQRRRHADGGRIRTGHRPRAARAAAARPGRRPAGSQPTPRRPSTVPSCRGGERPAVPWGPARTRSASRVAPMPPASSGTAPPDARWPRAPVQRRAPAARRPAPRQRAVPPRPKRRRWQPRRRARRSAAAGTRAALTARR